MLLRKRGVVSKRESLVRHLDEEGHHLASTTLVQKNLLSQNLQGEVRIALELGVGLETERQKEHLDRQDQERNRKRIQNLS